MFEKNDYEAIINEDYSEQYKIGANLDYKVNETPLKVVGYYHSNIGLDKYLVNENTIKYNLIINNSDLIIINT